MKGTPLQSKAIKSGESTRPWYRPQFSLRSILIVTSVAAIILAINFWPPTITSHFKIKPDDHTVFHAQYGWPFQHLDFKLAIFDQAERSSLDVRGWPVGHPTPPHVTHWYKFAANVLVQFAMAATLAWIIKWFYDMCRAVRSASSSGMIKAWMPMATLCMTGTLAIIIGILGIHFVSVNVANWLWAWGFEKITVFWALKQLFLPPLLILMGLFMLATARRWLHSDSNKVRMTAVVVAAVAAFVIIDGIGQSVFELVVFDMLKES